jgi:hypothetical protein
MAVRDGASLVATAGPCSQINARGTPTAMIPPIVGSLARARARVASFAGDGDAGGVTIVVTDIAEAGPHHRYARRQRGDLGLKAMPIPLDATCVRGIDRDAGARG